MGRPGAYRPASIRAASMAVNCSHTGFMPSWSISVSGPYPRGKSIWTACTSTGNADLSGKCGEIQGSPEYSANTGVQFGGQQQKGPGDGGNRPGPWPSERST